MAMFRSLMRATATALLAGLCAAAAAQPGGGDRGQLLYATHCDACHTTEIHWRDKRLVRNFASLVTEVRRWQANIGLGWEETDIGEVSRYLNATIYHFAPPDERVFLESGKQLR
jgi:mono/diheme cytochrome c family protein